MIPVKAARCPDPALDRLLVSADMMADPYPVYRRLRGEAPVFWSDLWNGWVVSRWDGVAATFKDQDHLSNENRQALLFEGLSPAELEELAPLRHYFAQKDVIGSDPPDHTRMRALVQKAFTPKAVAALGPRIKALAAEMIGTAADGPFDFIGQVAHPLPVIVIAETLGAPPEDRPLFKRWSSEILAFQGTGRTTHAAARVSQAALLELFDYMNRLIDDRRANPREDVITALAAAETDEGRFTRDELLATCNTLLTAGHETTTNLIGNLVHLLLTHPGQWSDLKADPALVAPAIEEALRYDAPKQRNFRRVKKAHDFRGCAFGEDEMVIQLIGSANRDPQANDDPDRFDITRGKIEHLSLGSGIHFCLGGPLARMEARLVLETLIEQRPGARLVPGSLQWQERVQFRGPKSLVLQ